MNGRILDEKTIARLGTYTHELSSPAPGAYIVTLAIESASRRIAQDLRLDVLEHARAG